MTYHPPKTKLNTIIEVAFWIAVATIIILALLLFSGCSDTDHIIQTEPDRQFQGGRFEPRETREELRNNRTDDETEEQP